VPVPSSAGPHAERLPATSAGTSAASPKQGPSPATKMSSGSLSDAHRWEAFRLVKADDVEGLQQALSRYVPEEWGAWRNFSGRTMYQVAEKESQSSGSSRCLQLLLERLQQTDLVPQQVPKVDYIDRVIERRECVDRVLQVPVQEVHHHKTLKHVPKFCEVLVPEVLNVERYTIKEELQLKKELVDVPKEVIHTTIREMPEIRHVVEKREETTEELLPFSLSPVDRVTEVHTVDVQPRMQFVTGERKIESEYEEVSVPYELYVPKTEVNYIDQVRVRPKEVSVPNIREYAVSVPVYEEREVPVVQKDIEFTQYIKHVPNFPMRTEWVPKSYRAGAAGPAGLSADFDMIDSNHDGVISREEFQQAVEGAQELQRADAGRSNVADLKYEMWYELQTLRFKSTHLGKSNAYLKEKLDLCEERVRQLGDSLVSERRLRQEQERQLEERTRNGMDKIVMRLKPLPVRTDSCAEADRIMSPNASTIYRSAHDMSGISSIGSPQLFTNRTNDLFDQLDRNHDGVISRDEFYAGMGRR